MRLAIIGAAAIAATNAAADDSWSDLSVSAGVEYAAGDFGSAADTKILYAPFSVKWDTPKFALRVTVPYIRIDGPGVVVGGSESLIAIGAGVGPASVESGLGDVVLAATYKLYPGPGSRLPFFEVVGKIKLPTADEAKGLGTGEADFTVQLNAFQSIGPLTPFASIGWRALGDPSGLELRNGVVATVGADFKLDPKFNIGATWDYRARATTLSEAASEISPYVVWSAGEGWAINAYGVFGFSDGSPDAGGGVRLTKSL
jgi:hypothetical protein